MTDYIFVKYQTSICVVIISLVAFSAHARLFCLAHRAEHQKHGENTLAGVKEALALGADGVEIDLRHTSDGVAIGVHDKVLWRVAESKPGKDCSRFTLIEKLTFTEIRENCALKNSEDIATLQEILNSLTDSDSFVLLQFKDIPTERTVRLINDFPNKRRLRIHSFWDSSLNQFEELATKSGLKVKMFKISKYWPRFSDTYGNNMWWPFRFFLDWKPGLREREVGLFLVDNENSLADAINRKVDFITTDNPSLCKTVQTR